MTAKEILDALDHPGEDEDVYYLSEWGTWHANGLPQVLDEIKNMIHPDKKHPNRDILLRRLQKTTLICIDMAEKAVQSCRDVLGERDVEL